MLPALLCVLPRFHPHHVFIWKPTCNRSLFFPNAVQLNPTLHLCEVTLSISFSIAFFHSAFSRQERASFTVTRSLNPRAILAHSLYRSGSFHILFDLRGSVIFSKLSSSLSLVFRHSISTAECFFVSIILLIFYLFNYWSWLIKDYISTVEDSPFFSVIKSISLDARPISEEDAFLSFRVHLLSFILWNVSIFSASKCT